MKNVARFFVEPDTAASIRGAAIFFVLCGWRGLKCAPLDSKLATHVKDELRSSVHIPSACNGRCRGDSTSGQCDHSAVKEGSWRFL